MGEWFICNWVVVMKVYLIQVLREYSYDWYRVLQNCKDVPEPVSGLCTETCLTACDIKVEEVSDMPEEEEEDPSAVKAEQEVSNVYIMCECWNSNVVGQCGAVLVSCVPEVDSLNGLLIPWQ
jgi:hypothetical protein